MTTMTIDALPSEDAAARLGIHPTELSKRVTAGTLRIERFRVGRRFMYPTAGIDRAAADLRRERKAKRPTPSPAPSTATARTVAHAVVAELEALRSLVDETLSKIQAAL